MRAALAEARKHGFVLVPVEPVPNQWRAAERIEVDDGNGPYKSSFTDGECRAVYRAMISALAAVNRAALRKVPT